MFKILILIFFYKYTLKTLYIKKFSSICSLSQFINFFSNLKRIINKTFLFFLLSRMFNAAYLAKIDLNGSLERERKRKQSICHTIRRGFFTNVRHLLENLKADPNELFEASTAQPLSAFLTPIISNINNSSGPPVITNLNLIINSIYSFHGRTPLMLCASVEDETWAYGIAQNLLEKGAKIGLKDPNGLNALMYACIHSNKSLVNLYLNALGDYHLLSVDNFGNTAIHIASLGQSESICKTLCDVCVKYDINPLTDIPKNKFGHTPYDLCFANGHKSCIDNYNKINEYFLSKRAKQQTSSRIQTAFKKEEPVLFRTPSVFSSETVSVSNSRLSSTHSSMNLHHNTFSNVNCPSILFERSESSFKTSKTLTTQDRNKPENNNNTQQHQYHASPSTNISPMTSTSTAPANASINLNHLSLANTPSPSLLNSFEIYKIIYPYKEHLIKANSVVTKKPKKEEKSNKSKAVVYELRPLTASKSRLKFKNKLEELMPKEHKIQELNLFESSSMKNDKNLPNKKEKTDNSNANSVYFSTAHNNLKYLSATNINSISGETESHSKKERSEESQALSDNSKHDTWRNSFNKIFDVIEYQKSDSFRKGHQYVPSSSEDLTAVHANFLTSSFAVNNSMNNVNLINKRLSVIAPQQPRKSLIPNGAGLNPSMNRKQSINMASLANLKMNVNRKTSVIATS